VFSLVFFVLARVQFKKRKLSYFAIYCVGYSIGSMWFLATFWSIFLKFRFDLMMVPFLFGILPIGTLLLDYLKQSKKNKLSLSNNCDSTSKNA
jgi:hypothetical protein